MPWAISTTCWVFTLRSSSSMSRVRHASTTPTSSVPMIDTHDHQTHPPPDLEISKTHSSPPTNHMFGGQRKECALTASL